ncbi:MAG: carbohydrate binding family 9 domain-containing protein [Armatimonadetes bacterium]|nr:carbohydrate binding family 9 domain-containing protein [Armatimonadota bacterium]
MGERAFRVGWLGLAASILSSLASAQAAKTMPAVQLATPPTIDGTLSSGEWSKAARGDGFWDPFSGKPAEDATEVYVGYDKSALYIAFYCHDRNPEQIIAREIRPGASLDGEDSVVVRIDPFFTRQSESVDRFLVNAIGTRSEDISSGRAAKREWRGEWDAKVGRVADGWTAEIRIPWTVLTYPSDASKMSINFVRFYGRGRNREIWSNMGPNFRGEYEGIWEGVQPPKPPAPKPLFLGYALGQADKDSKTVKGDIGLDIKYQPSPQMTIIGTLNPDFKNVEQQVERAQFTRSERYLEDSRPFFAEGSGQFYLSEQYGVGRLFYSRRIRDFDAGAKVYGRLNPKISLSALATTGVGGEQNAVFNLRHVLPNGGDAGIFGTVHKGGGRDDTVLGGSFNRRFGNYELNFESMRETDTEAGGSAGSYGIGYTVPKFFLGLRRVTITENFDPALSYIQFGDKKGNWLYTEYRYSWNGQWLKEVEVSFFADDFDRYSTGKSLMKGYDFFGTLTTRDKNQLEFSVENRSYEGISDKVSGLYFAFDPENRFRNASIGQTWGTRGGKAYRYYSLDVTRRLVGKLDAGLSVGIEDFTEGSRQYIGTIGWEFDAKRAITGRWVQTDGKSNGYVAYRSSGFAGNEWFVILGDPNAAKFKPTLTLKFVWPF